MMLYIFITDGNDGDSISADLTPSTSSLPEPQDQVFSSAVSQPANSTPQSSSVIHDIGKPIELGIDLKSSVESICIIF